METTAGGEDEGMENRIPTPRMGRHGRLLGRPALPPEHRLVRVLGIGFTREQLARIADVGRQLRRGRSFIVRELVEHYLERYAAERTRRDEARP